MAEGVTSVRLGDLTEAVDREARLARRSRSEMIRYLIEDGLRMRHPGSLRTADPEAAWIERFDGCATPDWGTTYRVLREAWDENSSPAVRTVYEWEPVTESSPGVRRRVGSGRFLLAGEPIELTDSQAEALGALLPRPGAPQQTD